MGQYRYYGHNVKGNVRVGLVHHAHTPTTAMATAYRIGWQSFQVFDFEGNLVGRIATVR